MIAFVAVSTAMFAVLAMYCAVQAIVWGMQPMSFFAEGNLPNLLGVLVFSGLAIWGGYGFTQLMIIHTAVTR